mgnify:CR=1 FL=1
MAYAMGDLAVRIGLKVEDDNEKLGLMQGNYKLCPEVNEIEAYIVERDGSKTKIDICEIKGNPVLDEYVD